MLRWQETELSKCCIQVKQMENEESNGEASYSNGVLYVRGWEERGTELEEVI